MDDIERRYAAGDIIFHEGQRARDATSGFQRTAKVHAFTRV